MEIYLDSNIISEPKFFYKGVRDDPNINVLKCSEIALYLNYLYL